MANETETTVEEVDEVVEPEGDETETDEWDKDRAKAAMKKKNQENKSLRDRLATLKKYEDEAKAAAEANKTSEDKYAEAVAARDSLQVGTWRMQAAWEAGLTPTQAKRLVGSTLEEFQADAETLKTDLGITEDTVTAPVRQPKELRGGSAPNEPAALDYKKIAEEAYARRR